MAPLIGREPRFLDRATPPHMGTLILMASLGSLATSIFLPSLEHMAEHFDASYATMQLAVAGFLAANAALQVVIGPIADRIGRRPVMLATLAVFAVATVGTLLAEGVGMFLLFRMLQASSAAGLVLARAIVRDTVPTEEAASTIGYITMGIALVPMAGPMLGGVLDEIFGWQSSFVVLLLMGLAVLALVALDLGETSPGEGRSLADQVRAYPALLTARRFWGYTLCAALSSGAFFALLGGTSYVAGTIYGLSPTWAGVALGAPAIGYALGNYLSGRYSTQVGINRMALLGCTAGTLGLTVSMLLTLGGLSHPALFFGFCCFTGLGNGLALPNVMAGSISVRPDLAASASGLSGAMMTGGGALLSILAGVILVGAETPLPLQALMAGVSALAGLSLLLARD
jgi:MFS transporter, DHA1 family, multidrug resistance protein